ncbi:MAG: hypothetical protein HOL66_12880 [Rhodospirillaceae bacterium]|jgi:hypothetical protein|nr:hypothetical protein [Rhodospirillaceae bacterium]MBT5245126.1 hypothetical protein [Rhodospirillaceae bacterium]MBT5562009.1 hypothetical protein [Rhodospirillaceae bacterium]MBT6242182.1 hypothetical protein [Rhodospirillaceae bacterium]MBT7136651.1 hypothetical protein [Rhodospirillaceae bacterium]
MNISNDNRSGASIRRDLGTAKETTSPKFTGVCLLLLLAFVMSFSARMDARAYELKQPVDSGSIRGKVHIGNAIPLVKRMQIFKDQKICGTKHRDIPLVQASGDGLLNTVVYLEDISSGKPFRAASKKITVNQLGCRFIPHLSVMANGGEIEIINSDTILHNIHTYEMVGPANFSAFSVSQPQRGDIVTKRIELKRSVGMRIMCDAHDFMRGFVFVARNPYYAIVDGDGEFFIDNVPPGTYAIKSWHGTLGEKQASVSIQPNGVVKIEFFY